jgi:hypothetical protein
MKSIVLRDITWRLLGPINKECFVMYLSYFDQCFRLNLFSVTPQNFVSMENKASNRANLKWYVYHSFTACTAVVRIRLNNVVRNIKWLINFEWIT